MIKKLLNRFFKSENVPTSPEHNTIMIWIGDDGLPYLKIYIVDTKEKSAKNFANMILDTNCGQYFDEMLELLVDISKQDLHINSYIKKVLLHCRNYSQTNNSMHIDTEPYVKPTFYNKYGK